LAFCGTQLKRSAETVSGKDNVGTSGGVAIDKIDRSGYGDCSSFDTLNVAIRWPRTAPGPTPSRPCRRRFTLVSYVLGANPGAGNHVSPKDYQVIACSFSTN